MKKPKFQVVIKRDPLPAGSRKALLETMTKYDLTKRKKSDEKK